MRQNAYISFEVDFTLLNIHFNDNLTNKLKSDSPNEYGMVLKIDSSSLSWVV